MKDAIKGISQRILQTSQLIQTEEATKNAYVMPFLQILGYDIFNPLEIVPEFTADIGVKNGEKVDYAVVLNGQPEILIECKNCTCDLCAENEGQLLRYFNVTKARFAILTNGIIYKFYTDLAEPNKMDLRPFLEINLLEPDKINFNELAKFRKENFDAENIRKTADLLKCTSLIRQILNKEFTAPSEEFVRMVFKKMTPSGFFNERQKEKLTPLVKAALDTMINEKVKANLDAALKTTAETQEAADTVHESVLGADTGVVTTEEELDAYHIVRAIGMELVPPEKIVMRDAKTYCAILFDNNNRKPICRLLFNNPGRKMILLFDGPQEEKLPVENISDLYRLKDRFLNTIRKYLEPEQK